MELENKSVKVAVVDDHDAIRLGFRGACAEYGLELLGSAATVSDLLKQLGGHKPQVVVLDLSLADGSMVEDNVRNLMLAGSQVVIFSIADKQNLIRAALKAGASTLVPKAKSMVDLVQAIRLVASGVTVNNLQTTAAIDGDAEFKAANLSPREREVLGLYASGFALKQVAHQLGMKESTAKEHIDRVRQKYSGVGREAPTKTELLLRAIEDGILDEGLL